MRRRYGLTSNTAPPEGMRGKRFTVAGEELAVLVIPSARASPLPELAPAESEVAQLVLRGLSNDEIATLRGTSPRTVANQLQVIYRKLEVGSRVELARVFRQGATGREKGS